VTSKLQDNCSEDEVALKSLFLGPQGENLDQVQEIFAHLLARWSKYRKSRFPSDGLAITSENQVSEQFQDKRKQLSVGLDSLLDQFEQEVPKFSPRYLGHMLSEVSLPALYGALVALLHNPNNVSSEASKVGLQIEHQAVQALAKMIGFSPNSMGHLTSCGSIANFEAVIRAKEKAPEQRSRVVLLPRHAHYCWEKIMRIIGLPRTSIRWVELDIHGRMSLSSLDAKLKTCVARGEHPFLVVSVFGTTEFGISDPIDEISNLLVRYKRELGFIWHHIDAAYGGFFAATSRSIAKTSLSEKTFKAMLALSKADSITIDPHKLGYLPYACGSFLCRTKSLYRLKDLKTPYLQHGSHSSDLWTIEGSRSAAGAIGIKLLLSILSLDSDGFGKILERTLFATSMLSKKMKEFPFIRILPASDLNILAFAFAKNKESLRSVSRRTLTLYNKFSPRNADAPYFVTKTTLDKARYPKLFQKFVESWNAKVDSDHLQVLRVCLMNPFLTSKEPKVHYLDDFLSHLIRVSKLYRT
jgi:glutamate/tyrosine decarboxylase-like PLP-dependent enzyme